MKSVWATNYQGNQIKIINTWFGGEQLFVNGVLQDKKFSFFSANLSGHLLNSNSERELIKVSLFGWFKIGCQLFIDDKKIEVTQEN